MWGIFHRIYSSLLIANLGATNNTFRKTWGRALWAAGATKFRGTSLKHSTWPVSWWHISPWKNTTKKIHGSGICLKIEQSAVRCRFQVPWAGLPLCRGPSTSFKRCPSGIVCLLRAFLQPLLWVGWWHVLSPSPWGMAAPLELLLVDGISKWHLCPVPCWRTRRQRLSDKFGAFPSFSLLNQPHCFIN